METVLKYCAWTAIIIAYVWIEHSLPRELKDVFNFLCVWAISGMAYSIGYNEGEADTIRERNERFDRQIDAIGKDKIMSMKIVYNDADETKHSNIESR